MSHQVGNPEDKFSHNEAYLFLDILTSITFSHILRHNESSRIMIQMDIACNEVLFVHMISIKQLKW